MYVEGADPLLPEETFCNAHRIAALVAERLKG